MTDLTGSVVPRTVWSVSITVVKEEEKLTTNYPMEEIKKKKSTIGPLLRRSRDSLGFSGDADRLAKHAKGRALKKGKGNLGRNPS